MGDWRIDTFKNINELESLKDIWLTMENIEGIPSIFQSWLWTNTWCKEVLATDPSVQLEVLAVEESNGRTIAIIPLVIQKVFGSTIKYYEFIGSRLSPHNDILMVEPQNLDLARHVVSALIEYLKNKTFIIMKNLSSESLFTKALSEKYCTEIQCDRIYIKKDTEFKDPSQKLSAVRRKGLRNSWNKLNRLGYTHFKIISNGNFCESFDEMIEMHHNRFKGKNMQSLLNGANLKFLKSVSNEMCKIGKAEIVELRNDDKIVASQISYIDSDRYFAYQAGFNKEFSKFSPVWLVDIQSMKRAFYEHGCGSYDLGQGYSKYKYSWEAEIGKNYFCCFSASKGISKFLALTYRNAFRKSAKRIYSDRNHECSK